MYSLEANVKCTTLASREYTLHWPLGSTLYMASREYTLPWPLESTRCIGL
jgi:hypothetical protein